MTRIGGPVAVLAVLAFVLAPGAASADGACVYVGEERIDTDSGSIYHPWPKWRC